MNIIFNYKRTKKKNKTKAIIKDGELVIATASVNLYKGKNGDQDNRLKARRFAFAKAVEPLPREVRTTLWSQFIEQMRQPEPRVLEQHVNA